MRPAMFARGSILIDTHRDTTLLPKQAVIFDPTSNRTRVFVASPEGKAVERDISIGYMNPKYVEVRNGAVTPKDKVIVAGQTTLQNGDPIRVQGQ